MTKKKQVYIVTAGTYSDYHILGVFDDKVLAEGLAELIKEPYAKANIEEWPLNPYKTELRAGGHKKFLVRMKRNGDTLEAYTVKEGFILAGDYMDCSFDPDGNLFLYVLAKDKKHAVKIANERRTVLIAMGKWNEGV